MRTQKVGDQRTFVNVLYYGDGGTGKTSDLAYMANLGRVLYFDLEGGIKRIALENLVRDSGMPLAVDNLEIFSLESNTKVTFQLLEDAFWQLQSDLEADPAAWAGVVWDSGTELYRILLDRIVETRVDKATKLVRTGKMAPDAVMADRFFIDRDNYGVMSEQMRLLLRRFRDLPCHFGSSFLERRDQDDRTHVVGVGPAVTPALQSDLVGYHEIVCRTRREADHYEGVTAPEGVRKGKDRYHALPGVLIDPTFDRIVAYVNGTLTAETDRRQGNQEAGQTRRREKSNA